MAQAQYATHGGGSRPQSTQFSFDPTYPAQQQNQMQYGRSDDFAFNQQQLEGGVAGPSILDQTDGSLLDSFFGNPDITNQMDFNFDPSTGAGAEDSKIGTAGGLYDLDNPSTTVHDPTTIFGAQGFNLDGDHQAQSYSNSNSQRQSMSMHMAGVSDAHDQSSEGPEEEEEKAAVEGLMDMSNHRPNPELVFGGANGGGFGAGSWGGINFTSPFLQNPNLQNSMFPRRQPAHNSEMDGQHGQSHANPFGYQVASPAPQYPTQPLFPMNTSMHMQTQSFPSQQRARHHSMANIHTDGLTHPPSNGPRSAQLQHDPTFQTYYNQSLRPNLTPRFGSDENFGVRGYRPDTNYTPTDEKAANLNHVPLADEASVNGHSSRHVGMQPPTYSARASSHQAQVYNSSSSQPSTPVYNNITNQPYLGGLPATPGSNAMSFGNVGAAGLHGHGHPQAQAGPQAGYYRAMHVNNPTGVVSQARAPQQPEQEDSSSERSESESDSPAPQPSRKRRKSNYERDGEDDDYRPAGGSKQRAQNRTVDGSSDEDEYERTGSGTGKKRARGPTTHRNSNTRTPPGRTPRPTSASATRAKRPSTTVRDPNVTRLPLTDEQRRQNHIMSEKNRRDLIKSNYSELNEVIPALKNGKSGLSKAEVLKEIVDFIEELHAGNVSMEETLGQPQKSRAQPQPQAPTPKQMYRGDGYKSEDDGDQF